MRLAMKNNWWRVGTLLCILAILPVVGHTVTVTGRTTASASVMVTLVIERCILVTDMSATPLQLDAPATDPVHFQVTIPACLANVTLDTTSITLNSMPIFPTPAPAQPRIVLQPGVQDITVRQADVLAILGALPGDRLVQLEATIGGGHRLIAATVVQVQATMPPISPPPATP